MVPEAESAIVSRIGRAAQIRGDYKVKGVCYADLEVQFDEMDRYNNLVDIMFYDIPPDPSEVPIPKFLKL